MTEKTEWEIVDAPAQDAPRQTPPQFLKHMLGPWWRWKIAGLVVAAGAALMFFLTIAAVFILGVMVVAVLSIGVGKVRQWLRARPGSAVREKR